MEDYFLTCDLTFVIKDFAGLNAGMLCEGMIIVVFLELQQHSGYFASGLLHFYYHC